MDKRFRIQWHTVHKISVNLFWILKAPMRASSSGLLTVQSETASVCSVSNDTNERSIAHFDSYTTWYSHLFYGMVTVRRYPGYSVKRDGHPYHSLVQYGIPTSCFHLPLFPSNHWKHSLSLFSKSALFHLFHYIQRITTLWLNALPNLPKTSTLLSNSPRGRKILSPWGARHGSLGCEPGIRNVTSEDLTRTSGSFYRYANRIIHRS